MESLSELPPESVKDTECVKSVNMPQSSIDMIVSSIQDIMARVEVVEYDMAEILDLLQRVCTTSTTKEMT